MNLNVERDGHGLQRAQEGQGEALEIAEIAGDKKRLSGDALEFQQVMNRSQAAVERGVIDDRQPRMERLAEMREVSQGAADVARAYMIEKFFRRLPFFLRNRGPCGVDDGAG